MPKSKWDIDKIPDLKGRLAIVTGSTSGLGKETARVMASKNATVVLAVRNIEKGERVAQDIKQQYPATDVIVRELDLSDLQSVNRFTKAFTNDHERLDLLINNAGVMVPPYTKTADGFELQFGTNHLGHFVLTEGLLPLLRITENSRIVVLSSVAHKFGKLDLADLNWKKRKYNKQRAYSDSKLANLYFALELARRLESNNNPLVTAAHPGWTSTELQRHTGTVNFLNTFFGQNVRMGALPTLRAAFDPEAKPGDYFGPSGFLEMQGYPVKVAPSKRAKDIRIAQKLWEASEKLTGHSYSQSF